MGLNLGKWALVVAALSAHLWAGQAIGATDTDSYQSECEDAWSASSAYANCSGGPTYRDGTVNAVCSATTPGGAVSCSGCEIQTLCKKTTASRGVVWAAAYFKGTPSQIKSLNSCNGTLQVQSC